MLDVDEDPVDQERLTAAMHGHAEAQRILAAERDAQRPPSDGDQDDDEDFTVDE